MNLKIKRSILALILVPLYILGFIALSQLDRSEFSNIISVYALVFIIYFIAVKYKLRYSLLTALILFAGTRIPFFFDLPHLTDDFYRFLWDGMLLNEGLNPIGRIPVEQHINNFKDVAFAEMLLANMNSPGYASVYPTFHQAFFGFAYFFAGSELLTGVNMMRAFIITFEMFFFIFILLRGRNKEHIYIYAYLLNPLVILEGVGNVHFEAIMLPFLAIALIDFSPRRYLRSAVPFTAAILMKINPILLAPMLVFKSKPKFRFYFIISTLFMLFVFMGMMEPWTFFNDFDKGLGLYFGTFEFNGSIYYALRELIQVFIGYNPISYLAPALAVLSAVLIVAVSWKWRRANIFELALVVFLIYYLLAATVHPWYLIPIVYLAIRSGRTYLLIWSFTAIFSYSHYLGEMGPKWILIILEYGLLAIGIILETRRRKWLQDALRG